MIASELAEGRVEMGAREIGRSDLSINDLVASVLMWPSILESMYEIVTVAYMDVVDAGNLAAAVKSGWEDVSVASQP